MDATGAEKGRPAGTGGRRKKRQKAKPFRLTRGMVAEAEANDRAAAELVVWWARMAGTPDRLAKDVERLQEEEKGGGRRARMFAYADLHELNRVLAEAACQFAGAGPQLPADYPDPFRGLAPARN